MWRCRPAWAHAGVWARVSSPTVRSTVVPVAMRWPLPAGGQFSRALPLVSESNTSHNHNLHISHARYDDLQERRCTVRH
eukprot:4932283-Prymnesium_polylepis.1